MLPFNKHGSWIMLDTIGFVEGSGPDTITAPGGNNTKGSWFQLTGQLLQNAAGLWVQPITSGANSASYLIDIGISETGAAAPSKILIPDLMFSISSVGFKGEPCLFPVSVSAPRTIWARYQTTATGLSIGAVVSPYRGSLLGNESLSRVAALGVQSSGTSRGTTVVPSTSTSTPGNWSDLSPAVPFDTRFVAWAIGNATNYVSQQDTVYLLELGAKATDGNYYSKAWMFTTGAGGSKTYLPSFGWNAVHVPKGYTLSCRAMPVNQTSVNNLDVVIYCVG